MAMPEQESARRSLAQIEASLSFVHQANIERYKSLLKTDLSDGERLLIRGQLAEEEAALCKMAGK
jgi:hypothetical protein